MKREAKAHGLVEILKKGKLSLKEKIDIVQKNKMALKTWEKEMFDETFEKWKQEFETVRKTKVPENFIALFTTKSKDEQKKLLTKQRILPYELLAFYCQAYTDYGFTFSEYKSEHLPNDLKGKEFPNLFYEDNNEIHKIGETSLSDGQLKHAIKNRNVIVSRFLDKGNEFHCFFTTHKSLKGEESGRDGQPHFHYISDKFGHSRDKVLRELKSKNYKLGTLPHIDVF
ncbi:MAG: hypothetical protein HOO91_03330 [Bacteroidales bacterium]|nr:hypothetical protein [Bacteroidales bacterium]